MRPHVLQQRALAELSSQLHGGGRGVVVMPCGSGKTLLGRWLAEQLQARLVVVCVPSLALVPQTLLAYRSQHRSWPHHAMIVCSDPTSGRAVRLDDVDLPSWARAEVDASTSARRIEEFLTGPTPDARLIVSTYHSAPRVAAALQARGVDADLLVCDEAHRLTGRPRSEFRTVLDEGALPARRRVFCTATPVEGAAWEADLDEDGVSAPLALDDEAAFGPTVSRASFADAVGHGLLVDYDVEVLAKADQQTAGAGGAVESVLAAARDGSRRILTFHSRVAHARAIAEALDGTRLPDGRVVRAGHLEARHRAERRKAALTRLTDTGPDTVTVVASARVLGEGIDVPAVDTVVFADPRRSAVDIVQAVGRAMRLAPGKTRGRIVLAAAPATVDELDPDTALAATAWRHVWIVLRALTEMDPRFARTLRAAAQHRHHTGHIHRDGGPGLRLTLPDQVNLDRWLLRALDRTGASWWHNLKLLRAWAAKHGHARPAASVYDHGVRLDSWVRRQRSIRQTLSETQVHALEALPGWAWTDLDIAWWQGYMRWLGLHATGVPGQKWQVLLKTCGFDVRHRPRRRYRTLAEFAADTCARRRRGELPSHLERVADQLPEWRWDLILDDDAALVDALDEYAAWKQDLNPPHDYRHDGDLPLGAWLTAIRRRRYTVRLHPALECELALLHRRHPDAVALRWETSNTAWRLAYLALRQYVDREGTCRIPYQHVEALPDHEVNLSRWCTVQRQERRYGRLSAERVAALAAILGWQWEVELRHGHRSVLGDVEHGTRRAYAKGCGCDPCCEANATYEHTRINGQGTDLVDAGRARAHVRILHGRGVSLRAIARAADLSRNTITELDSGETTRLRPETEAAVLALTYAAARAAEKPGRHGDLVPASEVLALVDDMVARKWPKAWISREIGQAGRALQLHGDTVSERNARAIQELHQRLAGRAAPARRWRASLPTLAELEAAERTAS